MPRPACRSCAESLTRRLDRGRCDLQPAARRGCCGRAPSGGCNTLDGLGMLVNQAVIGFKIWTGREPDAAVHARCESKSTGAVARRTIAPMFDGILCAVAALHLVLLVLDAAAFALGTAAESSVEPTLTQAVAVNIAGPSRPAGLPLLGVALGALLAFTPAWPGHHPAGFLFRVLRIRDRVVGFEVAVSEPFVGPLTAGGRGAAAPRAHARADLIVLFMLPSLPVVLRRS